MDREVLGEVWFTYLARMEALPGVLDYKAEANTLPFHRPMATWGGAAFDF
jgi:hypothetical protein